MKTVFERGGDLVSIEVAHNFMRLVAEGPSGDEDQVRWGDFNSQLAAEFII